MTEQIFANNFWGLKDDGFQVLTAKMNSNKKTFDEIKSFYNVRYVGLAACTIHRDSSHCTLELLSTTSLAASS